MEHGYGRDVGEDGDWNRPGAYGVGKTTTRTYSTPNGTLVTEVNGKTNTAATAETSCNSSNND